MVPDIEVPKSEGLGTQALDHIRICDFSGQLAGAGATKILAAFGAQVIRVEDPVTEGRWDALRGVGPFLDDRRGVNLGGGFNNHNVGKLGITVNMRTESGRRLVQDLIAVSDVVCENFAPGVMAKWGLGYEELRAIRSNVIYVSNSGFGHTGPYRAFKTWGPIVQAVSGLTYTAGLPDLEPAGWGYSYMDHGAAFYMAIAILAALHHRARTGEGQWVDLASTAAGSAMLPTEVLDWSVNGRPNRRPGRPGGNRADFEEMAPHGIYPAQGSDRWIAIACRNDADWDALARLIGEAWTHEPRFAHLPGRLAAQDELDRRLTTFTEARDPDILSSQLLADGVPASVVKSPPERIDGDCELSYRGLFPEVVHPEVGRVRVEGLPMVMTGTNWSISMPSPCLGEHNEFVFGEILGRSAEEIDMLRTEGAI